MRMCPYRGKEHPDEFSVCPTDQNIPTGAEAIPRLDDFKRLPRKRGLKIIAAGLAYIPMFLLLLVPSTVLRHPLSLGCVIFNYPAFSLLTLVESFHPARPLLYLSCWLLMLGWSSCVAWFFWRTVGVFQGEEEPPASQGKYDWAGFRVRFFIGFIFGSLIGWRFVAYTTSKSVVIVATVICAIFCGFLYGISSPPNFWSRR